MSTVKEALPCRPQANTERKSARETPPPVFHIIAKKKLLKEDPQTREKIEDVLKAIDKQGISNFRVFEPKETPPVKFAYTKVEIDKLVPELMPEQTSDHRIIEFVFHGYALPPEGNPFTAWDNVYDKVFHHLSDAKNISKKGEKPPQVVIYSLGAPSGIGGEVSKEWLKAVRKKGFSQHADAVAELVREVLPKDQEEMKKIDKIVFHGISMGCSKAAETALKFPELKGKTLVKLESPPGIEKPITEHPLLERQTWQVILGCELEGKVRKLGEIFTGKKDNSSFNSYLENDLIGNNIIFDKNKLKEKKKQNRLKMKAIIFDTLNLFKESIPMTFGNNYYIEEGLFDPLSFKKSGFKERFIKALRNEKMNLNNNAVLVPVFSSHVMNHLKIKDWAKIVENNP